jgi:hypothetical protein
MCVCSLVLVVRTHITVLFFAFAFAFAAVVEPDTGADPMVRIVKEFLGDEVTPDLEEVILSAATSFRETAVE